MWPHRKRQGTQRCEKQVGVSQCQERCTVCAVSVEHCLWSCIYVKIAEQLFFPDMKPPHQCRTLLQEVLQKKRTAVQLKRVFRAVQTIINTVCRAARTTSNTVRRAVRTTINTECRAMRTTINTVCRTMRTRINTVCRAVRTTINTVWRAVRIITPCNKKNLFLCP